MKILLDTHFILWALLDQKRLSSRARAIIEAEENQILFSVASLWEIAIKRTSGKRDFKVAPQILRRTMLESDYLELSLAAEHVFETSKLPLLHKDPFDRILIAQAMVEGMTLLTADAVVAKYPGPIQLV